MQGLALIDHDNFRRRDRKSRADMEIDARTLVESVARTFIIAFPDTRELDIRLYGGWTDETGGPSRDATWLHELLPNLRGRRHGLIIRPALATTMIRFPGFLLRGTVRGHGRNQRQKMIDGMMGCDAFHVTSDGRTYVGIVTDDDDLLPAALSAHGANAGRGRRLLDGVRGAPPADTDALIRLLVAVSEFAVAAGGALEALDLNPVIVHPRGQGVSVADAGIVTGVARPTAAARNP